MTIRHKRILAAVVAGVAGLAGAALAAAPASAKTHYTHATTLKRDCPVYANYPKAGIDRWGWTVTRKSSTGRTNHVGVRYTVNSRYALILDTTRGANVNPHWGFVARSCLTDSYAYAGATRLGNLRAVGGNGRAKTVPFAPAARSRHGLIHAGGVGTLRSAPKSFAIGNVRSGDPFYLTTAHCGHHSSASWVFGYAPRSGRWGYVQAGHFAACH